MNEQKHTLSWWQMTSVQIGGAICMPVLMVGEQLGRAYGFSYAVVAILLGNTILGLLALAMAHLSFDNKKNTVENAQIFFGRIGTYVLAVAMTIGLTGWFAIQLNVITLSVQHVVAYLTSYTIPLLYANIILGVAMSVLASYGMKALIWLSDVTMPLLIGIILYSVVYAYAYGTPLIESGIASYAGISLVIATAIMAVIDIPTYYRYAATRKDSIISILILFFGVLPLLELAGVYIYLYSAGDSIVTTLTGNGTCLWQLLVVLFLVFAGWTTNNANLYSATVAVQTLCPAFSYAHCLYMVGVVGTIIACFPVLASFESMLNGMGITISALGAAIIAGYIYTTVIGMRITPIFYSINMIAVCTGVLTAFATCFEYISLTTIPLLDAFGITAMSVVLLQTIFYLLREIHDIYTDDY